MTLSAVNNKPRNFSPVLHTTQNHEPSEAELLQEEEPAPEELELIPAETDAVYTDSVKLYLKEIGSHPILSAEEELELAKHIAEQDALAEEAFARLVNCNLRLVVAIAKKYLKSGMDLLDLVQDGNMGLMKAASKFDYTKGYKFSTYATWWIRQGIHRGVSDKSRTIRIPVHLSEKMGRIRKMENVLTGQLHRKPTIEELAEAMDMNPEKLTRLLSLSQVPASLEAPVGDDADSFLGDFIVDQNLPTPEAAIETSMMTEDVREALSILTRREQKIIRLRFGFDDNRPMTLEEVGAIMGVTRERVRQIESKALRQMRSSAKTRHLRDYTSA